MVVCKMVTVCTQKYQRVTLSEYCNIPTVNSMYVIIIHLLHTDQEEGESHTHFPTKNLTLKHIY